MIGLRPTSNHPWTLAWAAAALLLLLPAAAHRTSAGPSRVELAGDEREPIILYTTSWCGYCRKTRALLDELGEPYIDKDIEDSPEARREYQAKGRGYTGVPLIDVDGRILRGYDEKTLRRLVRERRAAGDEELAP